MIPLMNMHALSPKCISKTQSGNGYYFVMLECVALHWRHNGRDGVSNHHPYVCLLSRLFRRRSKKTSKLRVTGRCEGNSPGTGEFSAQIASNAEKASIWWRHHEYKNHELVASWSPLPYPSFTTPQRSNPTRVPLVHSRNGWARRHAIEYDSYDQLYWSKRLLYASYIDVSLHRHRCLVILNQSEAIRLTVWSTNFSDWQKRNGKARNYWPFVRGIRRWSVESPHKGQ